MGMEFTGIIIHTKRKYLPNKFIMNSETYTSNSLYTSTKSIQLLILSPIEDVHKTSIKSEHNDIMKGVIQFIHGSGLAFIIFHASEV
jgi:hypothetical protein